MICPKCDARKHLSVPGKFALAVLIVVLGVIGCRSTPLSKPAPEPAAAAVHPPPLALETFDAVWRMIHEHHFDTNFNGVDWEQARMEYRPQVASAESSHKVREVIQEMLDLLDVSHLAIVPSQVAQALSTDEDTASLETADEAQAGTTGLHVRFADDRCLVTRVDPESPAAAAGIKPGWVLTGIESKPVADFISDSLEGFDAAKRDFHLWRLITNELEGEPGTEVVLSFLSGNDLPVVLTVARVLRPGEPIEFGGLPVLYADLQSTTVRQEPRIGLIRFNIWMLPTAIAFNQAVEEHRHAGGIIIDLRGNVGGVVGMIIGVAGHFFTEPLSLGTLITRDNRLNLFVNPRLVSPSGKRVRPYAGPVAILVDEISASASEVFAGGMKELGRARVFGRATSGQALPAIYEDLPNGDALYHPFGDFITESGVRFEGRGVIPDEEVALDRQALLAGDDRTLEAAIQWIVREVE